MLTTVNAYYIQNPEVDIAVTSEEAGAGGVAAGRQLSIRFFGR